MHNTHLMAPTSLHNPTKLDFCTTPYPELALDKWMGQNSTFYHPKHTSFTQHLDQYKYTQFHL